MSSDSVLQRDDVLKALSKRILQLPQKHVLKIAIDGVDGAGKTTFADELAHVLNPSRRKIIRASVDGFHNLKEIRYQRGRMSSEGFFLDSYNYSGLKEFLLDPLSPGGSGRYRKAIFDHTSNLAIQCPEEEAIPGSILIFDGIFLHRSEIRAYWDFSIFLEVDFKVSIPRGAKRGPGFGSADPDAIENRRYIEGQKLYLNSCKPKKYATIVIDNNDLFQPLILNFCEMYNL